MQVQHLVYNLVFFRDSVFISGLCITVMLRKLAEGEGRRGLSFVCFVVSSNRNSSTNKMVRVLLDVFKEVSPLCRLCPGPVAFFLLASDAD